MTLDTKGLRALGILLVVSLVLACGNALGQDQELARRSFLSINAKRQLLGMQPLSYLEPIQAYTEAKLDSMVAANHHDFSDPDQVGIGNCKWEILISQKDMRAFHKELIDLKRQHFRDDVDKITIATHVGEGWYIAFIRLY